MAKGLPSLSKILDLTWQVKLQLVLLLQHKTGICMTSFPFAFSCTYVKNNATR